MSLESSDSLFLLLVFYYTWIPQPRLKSNLFFASLHLSVKTPRNISTQSSALFLGKGYCIGQMMILRSQVAVVPEEMTPTSFPTCVLLMSKLHDCRGWQSFISWIKNDSFSNFSRAAL